MTMSRRGRTSSPVGGRLCNFVVPVAPTTSAILILAWPFFFFGSSSNLSIVVAHKDDLIDHVWYQQQAASSSSSSSSSSSLSSSTNIHNENDDNRNQKRRSLQADLFEDDLEEEIEYAGNNGYPPQNFPLGRCQGDCDTDLECQPGLICEPVGEGCHFDEEEEEDGLQDDHDYCIAPLTPLTNATSTSPSTTFVNATTTTITTTNTTNMTTTFPPTATTDLSSLVTVGVYYYAWQKNKLSTDPSRSQGYLRDQLDPRQRPVLGHYDDSESRVIRQHLQWSRQANIRVWVCGWWGPWSGTDRTLRDSVLPELEDQPPPDDQEDDTVVKMAILYETKSWYNDLEAGDVHNDAFERLEEDFEFLCDRYFDHPNYYRIGDRPVVAVYLTRKLQRVCGLAEAIRHMRRGCQRHDLYIIGDHVWGSNPESSFDKGFPYLDAVTNYDVYGNMGKPRYAGSDGVKEYYERAANWKEAANLRDVGFVPSVTPGYNDRGRRRNSDNQPLSRRLTEDAPEGSLFEAMLQEAVPMVDPLVDNLLLVTSFNEWHEDTQIEPCQGGTPTKSPLEVTDGLEYEGYGDLYLDILRRLTAGTTQPAEVSRSDNSKQQTGLLRAGSSTTRQGSDDDREQEQSSAEPNQMTPRRYSNTWGVPEDTSDWINHRVRRGEWEPNWC